MKWISDLRHGARRADHADASAHRVPASMQCMRHYRAAHRSRRLMAGMSMIELAVAVPVLLGVGMGLVQLIMIYHARQSAEFALHEAARAGAVEHADVDAILGGLARGLAPWKEGASSMTDKLAAEGKMMIALKAGLILPGHGALTSRMKLPVQNEMFEIRQLSPTIESFEDWAQPRVDEASGRIVQGQDEIPNDNLHGRRTRSRPNTGVAGHRGNEPIGARSGQTLSDANILRLQLTYGVELRVPGISTLFLKALRTWYGCDSTLGMLANASAGEWRCVYYAQNRLPVQATATIHMMSPVWRSPLLQAAIPSEIPLGQATTLGAGTLHPLPVRKPVPVNQGPAPTLHGQPFMQKPDAGLVYWGSIGGGQGTHRNPGHALTDSGQAQGGSAQVTAEGTLQAPATRPEKKPVDDDNFVKPPPSHGIGHVAGQTAPQKPDAGKAAEKKPAEDDNFVKPPPSHGMGHLAGRAAAQKLGG